MGNAFNRVLVASLERELGLDKDIETPREMAFKRLYVAVRLQSKTSALKKLDLSAHLSEILGHDQDKTNPSTCSSLALAMSHMLNVFEAKESMSKIDATAEVAACEQQMKKASQRIATSNEARLFLEVEKWVQSMKDRLGLK